MSKYYCTVISESDYVVEADSREEAYEAAWDAARAELGHMAVIVAVDTQKVVYQ